MLLGHCGFEDSFTGQWYLTIVIHWWKFKPVSKNKIWFIINIFLYEEAVLNIDPTCNFDNFSVMKHGPKKWSSPLTISSVNVTKYAGNSDLLINSGHAC